MVQQLTSKITEFDSPHYFVDEMVSGAFKSFKHEHIFTVAGNQTIMTDKFDFQSPYGIFGKIANVLVVKRYLTNLLRTRNSFLKQKAEELSPIQ